MVGFLILFGVLLVTTPLVMVYDKDVDEALNKLSSYSVYQQKLMSAMTQSGIGIFFIGIGLLAIGV